MREDKRKRGCFVILVNGAGSLTYREIGTAVREEIKSESASAKF